jgi:hypothetical protein
MLRARRIGTALVLAILTVGTARLAKGDTGIVRITVHKQRTLIGSPPIIRSDRVTSPSITAAGAVMRADYGSHTLYEVPSTAAQRLIDQLEKEGTAAEIATDLDEVRFQEYSIDPDAGTISPPVDGASRLPEGQEGLYILVFKGYPVDSWLTQLRARNFRIVQELPPAAYLVRGNQLLAGTLTHLMPEVRGVFPLLPVLKIAFPRPYPEPSAYRPVAVSAVEESANERLSAYLETAAEGPIHVRRDGTRAHYAARLTELDVGVLSNLGNVYSVVLLQDQYSLSAERQGQLVLSPCISDSPCGPPINSPALTLPTAPPHYWEALQSMGLSDFSNTRVGVLDTGFHTGDGSPPRLRTRV